MLAPVYSWFTEGFDTVELQAAKVLLEAVRRPGVSMLEWPEYGKLLVALWALINPLGAITIFLSLTENHPAARQHIGSVAAVAVGVILIAFVFVGQAVLQVFGIQIMGLLIAAIAIEFITQGLAAIFPDHPRAGRNLSGLAIPRPTLN